MAQKQVATYAIKVDLDCEKCREKIKKVLCKIPQIQDQLYDEKNNIVVVKVVCCNPDKVKKKICCNGGKVVKGIELFKPPKPKDDPPKKKDDDKPKEAPKPPQVVVVGPVLGRTCCRECSEGRGGGPCWALYGRPCYSSNQWHLYGRPVYDSWGGGGSYVGYNQPTSFYADYNPSGCSIM